jgi:protoporphyrinogen oxidase
VMEIPCSRDDEVWARTDQELIDRVTAQLCGLKWFEPRQILGSLAIRMQYAYPILELGFEEKSRRIFDGIRGLENLHILGRSGRFQYTHIHDLMRAGKDLVASIRLGEPAAACC